MTGTDLGEPGTGAQLGLSVMEQRQEGLGGGGATRAWEGAQLGEHPLGVTGDCHWGDSGERASPRS